MFKMDDGHWRWNREPTILGIPGTAFIPVVLTLYIRSWGFFYFVCCVIIFYSILKKMGITPQTLFNKLAHLLRGKKITARPFWYRKRFQGK